MAIKLFDWQFDALKHMKNGCILNGGVGSGKSITAIAYYYIQNGGNYHSLLGSKYDRMTNPKDLYIITTARKRDTKEWESELEPFLLSPNQYSNTIVIDSWNNVQKYIDVRNAFFIFDEQRVVGYGSWAKAFRKIAKSNDWIMLSATPGDTWMDYVPVFIANGFFKTKKEFVDQHVIWDPYTPFPRVKAYHHEGRLIRLRDSILISMADRRNTISHNELVRVGYDCEMYNMVSRDRRNPYVKGYIPVDDKDSETLEVGIDISVDEIDPIMPGWEYEPKDGDLIKLVCRPIESASEYCYTLRRVVNSSNDRILTLQKLVNEHDRVIVFYNFDYELDILKSISYGNDYAIAEWNGHKHEVIPNTKKWVYLVQYTAGCEGWNCILTDSMIFYSQNYSFKVMEQAKGRINRLNTKFTDLYYYQLASTSKIDLAISQALKNKKKFNERRFTDNYFR